MLKYGLAIALGIFGFIFGNCMIQAGFQMVGESGVSQEIVNAMVGTIGVVLGCWLIIYTLYKAVYICIIKPIIIKRKVGYE